MRTGAIKRGRYRPSRTENPGAFYFFLALYTCGGLALLVWGVLVVAGVASPLPLS